MQRSNKSKQHELLQRQSEEQYNDQTNLNNTNSYKQSEEQYKDQTNLNNTNSYKDSLKNNTKIKQI
jgi:hypothetical protein